MNRSRTAAWIFLPVTLALCMAGCVPVGPETDPRFVGHEVAVNPTKPASVRIADLDGDAVPELVVSAFANSGPLGAGYVDIYTRAGGLDAWTRERLPGSTGTKFPNAIHVTDVDHDGDPDLIVPSGFLACAPFSCGGLAWYEQAGGWVKHELASDQSLFYHHAELVDLDGDGLEDLVTVGERMLPAQEAYVQVFPGTGSGDRFASEPVDVAEGLGSFPTVLDLDGDGDLDVVSAQFFPADGAAAWLEQVDPATWVKHVVEDTMGPSIQLALVENLCGDGRWKALLSNHSNTLDDPSEPESAVALLDVPETYGGLVSPWPRTKISEGIQSDRSPLLMPKAAPGVFAVGDVDGDGDRDVVVNGDGDPNVYLLEQTAPCVFATHVLITDMPQGAVDIADLNGDGLGEIVVSSYEKNRLYVLEYVGAP